jgi:maltose/moltooligosaccharide transporter
MNKDAVGGNHIPQITMAAFMIGAFLSSATIAWSMWRVPELPLTPEQRQQILAQKRGFGATLREIWDAILDMPKTMRQLALMKLFQWYGMICYWQYVVYAIARSLYGSSDPTTAGFRDAVLDNGQLGGFYNAIAFVAAFAMVPFTRRFGAGRVHALCLVLAGLGMLAIPSIDSKALLFIPMIGIGLGWASIMGNPYVMLARSIPAHRTGVYMGIFNMFIVIPMLIQSVTLPLYYRPLLGGDPRNVLMLAGALLLAAAVATLWVKVPPMGSNEEAASSPARA